MSFVRWHFIFSTAIKCNFRKFQQRTEIVKEEFLPGQEAHSICLYWPMMWNKQYQTSVTGTAI